MDKKTLERIAYEVNPKNDLDGLDYKDETSLVEHVAKYMARVPKHLVRGAVVGGLAGTVIGALCKAPFLTSLLIGAGSGAFLDFMQYGTRYQLANDRLYTGFFQGPDDSDKKQ
ncbi:hypothetical protein JW756_02150 [Candidatus Woesearchaeota archaeon]|nr:hypothetical protein [Candidatus Woesearchaeota archaeon]